MFASLYSGSRYWFLKRLSRNLAIILAIASVLSGLGTYIIITSADSPYGTDINTASGLILVNLVFLLALGVIIARKLVALWENRRSDSVGSRLQARIVLMFGLISSIPTVIVAVSSAFFFHYGVQSWFNEQVGNALEQSVLVAESYLDEHKAIIRADAILMANDLNREAATLISNPSRFKKIVPIIAGIRKVPEAIVLQEGKVLGRTPLSISIQFLLNDITPSVLERARAGEVVILTEPGEDSVHAFLKLENFYETYLIIGRYVDSKILEYMENTKSSASEYYKLRSNISTIQLRFLTLFLAVAMVLLLASIWGGIAFANYIVRPVSLLVNATEKVKEGNLAVRVPERPQNDEFGTLARAFNRMTGQLEQQREALVNSNEQSESRRRFTEAVLSGVSAGVVALDEKKTITLANPSAIELLQLSEKQLIHKAFSKVLPEADGMLAKAEKRPHAQQSGEITLERKGKQKQVLQMRIVPELFSDGIEGYIVTFDDITDLQAAQRQAAWSDVARRIAHEIKNPLTPITLSVERLRRKYHGQVEEEQRAGFRKYLDTITRHVSDIGHMVEEFVNFARLPTPKKKQENLNQIVQDVVFSEQERTREVTITSKLPKGKTPFYCDKAMLSQALGNLIKNATESILQAQKRGEITVTLKCPKNRIELTITDNGPGFPEDMLDRLTEPYITTREKGTGLGLAIVKKIVEDHEGTLALKNIHGKNATVEGACVTILFHV